MRTYVVTGCSNGLGKAICEQLLGRLNTMVIGIDIGIPTYGGPQFKFCAIDLSNVEEIQSFSQYIDKSGFGVDVLINCAGVAGIRHFHELSEEDWDSIMAVNAKAPVFLTQTLLPRLIQSQGSVINILSDAAARPMRASLAYCASKAAAAMVTRQLARELSPRVRVLGIAPAKIADTMMTRYLEEDIQQVRKWTPEYAETYHRSQVLMERDIDKNVLAQFIVDIAARPERLASLSGCIIPFGG